MQIGCKERRTLNLAEYLPILIPLLAGMIIAAIPGILALFKGRTKEKADAAKSIAEGAALLIEQYESRLADLEEIVKEQAKKIKCQDLELAAQGVKIEDLESEREEFISGLTALCDQLREAGLEPVWEPNGG